MSTLQVLYHTRRLQFADHGQLLLHSTQVPYSAQRFVAPHSRVAVWDLHRGTLRYRCPGVLLGTARDDETFLTYHPTDPTTLHATDFHAWHLPTGQEVALRELAPDSYALHQRALPVDRDGGRRTLWIYDVLHAQWSGPFPVVTSEDEGLDSWAIAPNDAYLVATLAGAGGGHDWASGKVLGIAHQQGSVTATGTVYTFGVNRFQGFYPPLHFSSTHNLFVMSSGNHNVSIYEMGSWQKIQQFLLHGYHFQATVHPHNPHLLAASTTTYAHSPRTYYIELVDLSQPAAQAETWVTSEQRTPQKYPIDGLLFHPHGDLLISLAGSTIRVWNVSTMQVVTTLKQV